MSKSSVKHSRRPSFDSADALQVAGRQTIEPSSQSCTRLRANAYRRPAQGGRHPVWPRVLRERIQLPVDKQRHHVEPAARARRRHAGRDLHQPQRQRPLHRPRFPAVAQPARPGTGPAPTLDPGRPGISAFLYQPSMFTKALGATLCGQCHGQPRRDRQPGELDRQSLRDYPVVLNATCATIQLLLAIGLTWRPTVRLALGASIVWSLAVWWLGDYALLAVLLWPANRTP
jgi:hypothetical protein